LGISEWREEKWGAIAGKTVKKVIKGCVKRVTRNYRGGGLFKMENSAKTSKTDQQDGREKENGNRCRGLGAMVSSGRRGKGNSGAKVIKGITH